MSHHFVRFFDTKKKTTNKKQKNKRKKQNNGMIDAHLLLEASLLVGGALLQS